MLLAAGFFDSFPILFVFSAFVVVAILVYYFDIHLERKRTAAMRQFAFENGFSFELRATSDLPLLPLTEFFRGKSALKIGNVLSGRVASTEASFAEVAHGTGKYRVTQTVAVFDTGAQLPAFHLKNTGLAARLGEMLGMQDIDFDGHPQFSNRYTLKAADEAATRAFFSPSVIAAAEALPPSGYIVAASGTALLVFHPEKRIPVDQLRKFVDETSLIAQAFTRALGKSSFGW